MFQLGNNLKTLRLLHKKKAVEIARKSGISRQYYSNIERGNVIPSLIVLKTLADALGVPAWILLKENGAEEWISASSTN